MQQAKQIPSRDQPRNSAAARVARTMPAAGFTDNRPAAIAQRKLAEVIKSSPRAVAQRALISAMREGSYGATQRKRLGSMFGETAQLAGGQEEELLQGKFSPVQRQGPEEEEMLQGKFAPVQRAEAESDQAQRENNTGLPNNLKAGIESLSGMSLDHVKVHYNSAQPAQLNALAYAQGSDIHVAPGQEQHLPHEAWHVVQQAQGRVRPTMQMKDGVPVNDDAGLEHEADVMGSRAVAGVAESIAENARQNKTKTESFGGLGDPGFLNRRIGGVLPRQLQIPMKGDGVSRRTDGSAKALKAEVAATIARSDIDEIDSDMSRLSTSISNRLSAGYRPLDQGHQERIKLEERQLKLLRQKATALRPPAPKAKEKPKEDASARDVNPFAALMVEESDSDE